MNSHHHHGTAHGASQTAAALDTVPEWIRAFPAERPQDRGVLYQHQARYGEAVARQVALHLAAIGGSRAVRNLGPRELLLQWPRAEHNHGGGVDHIFVDPGAGWRRSQLKLVPGAGSGGDSAMEWQVITEGFDGETVWRQAGMSPARALEGVERDGVLLEAALRSMRYLDPGWPLVRIEEAAPETLAAGIHDALDLVAPAGTRARLFFDRAERVVRAVQYIASGPTGAPPPGMPRWVEWEDYRFHRGVACPFRFDVSPVAGGPEIRQEIVVSQAIPGFETAMPVRGSLRDFAFERGDRTRDIPLVVGAWGPQVTVQLGGHGSVALLLDPTAAISSLDRDWAAGAGWDTGQVSSARGRIEALRLGELRWNNPPLALERLPFVGGSPGGEAAVGTLPVGRLGRDFFERFVVRIDLAAGILGLEDPATHLYMGGGPGLRMVRSEAGPRVVGLLQERRPGRFALDLTYGGGVEMTQPFAERNELLSASGGPEAGALTLLTFRFENPPVEVVPGSALHEDPPDGRLGRAIWERFHLVLDLAGERGWLEPSGG